MANAARQRSPQRFHVGPLFLSQQAVLGHGSSFYPAHNILQVLYLPDPMELRQRDFGRPFRLYATTGEKAHG